MGKLIRPHRILEELELINKQVINRKNDDDLKQKSFEYYKDFCHYSEEIFLKCLNISFGKIKDFPSIALIKRAHKEIIMQVSVICDDNIPVISKEDDAEISEMIKLCKEKMQFNRIRRGDL